MSCPLDATTLEVVNRSVVEIDQSGAAAAPSHPRAPMPTPVSAERYGGPRVDDLDERRRYDGDGDRPRKHKDLPSGIFDC